MRDPRDFCRERLSELRERNEAAFGRLLAQLTAERETIQVDPWGKAHPYAAPVPPDHLVLHLPTAERERAITVRIPARLSRPSAPPMTS